MLHNGGLKCKMILIKNADVYAPRHIGISDILICGERIFAIETSLKEYEQIKGIEVIDVKGMRTMPGYIDQHVHITGGGGEQGFSSRVPEVTVSDIINAGVTTVLGMLGTDSITRTLENVLAKSRGLEGDGITAYMLTGSYSYPPVTMTGSISRDIVLIDKIIGAKIALSDHRSSNISKDEFIRFCAEARLGGIISGKAGITVIHMGTGKGGFKHIYALAEESDVPINNILPTHVGRSKEVLLEAIKFAKDGGNMDITAGQSGIPGDSASQVAYALECGVSPDRITISSDGCGSQPVFNEVKECIGLTYTLPNVIHEEIKVLIEKYSLPVEIAISFITSNVARIMGLKGHKGEICVGADADIVIWDEQINIEYVFAKGKIAKFSDKLLIKGRFEK